MDYTSQIQRIKEKLGRLKKQDSDLEIFGASSHKYQMNPPMSLEKVKELEQEYGVSLPEDYVAFITQVGNGGEGYGNQAAGPYYGIYPIEYSLKDAKEQISNEAILSPKMTDTEWNTLTDADNVDISDEDNDKLMNKAYGGVMRLGDQGCLNYHALIISGKHKGCIVYLPDDYKPFFCFENNFLDWYERWLNEGLSGLLYQTSSWFGYSMGGNDYELVSVIENTTNEQTILDALGGFYKLPAISSTNGIKLLELTEHSNYDIVKTARNVLAKYHFKFITNQVTKLVQSENIEDFNESIRLLYYVKDTEHIKPYVEILKQKTSKIKDSEAFWDVISIIKTHTNVSEQLVEATKNENPKIVNTAIYELGKLETKADYESLFIEALENANDDNVITILQALKGLEKSEHFPLYKHILFKFHDTNKSVKFNVFHRLEALGETYFDSEIFNYFDTLFQVENYNKDFEHYYDLNNLLCNFKRLPKLFLPIIKKAVNHPNEPASSRAKEILKELEL